MKRKMEKGELGAQTEARSDELYVPWNGGRLYSRAEESSWRRTKIGQ